MTTARRLARPEAVSGHTHGTGGMARSSLSPIELEGLLSEGRR